MADEHDIGGSSERPPELPAKAARPAPMAEQGGDDASSRARGEAQVNDLRRRIDQIDDQLMKLLNSRSACAVRPTCTITRSTSPPGAPSSRAT